MSSLSVCLSVVLCLSVSLSFCLTNSSRQTSEPDTLPAQVRREGLSHDGWCDVYDGGGGGGDHGGDDDHHHHDHDDHGGDGDGGGGGRGVLRRPFPHSWW
jgi:hypothetical protein